jgi:hypothetical protein
VSQTVTNNVADTTLPTVLSIETTSDTTIVITFDENIQASDISNALTQFELFIDGVLPGNPNPSSITINANTATLTVATIPATGATLELSYTKVNTANQYITDTAGASSNQLNDFTTHSVTNNIPTVTKRHEDSAFITTGVSSTITFVTTNLVNDATRPYIKITLSNVACNNAPGTSDAVDHGQLVYVSATEGTITVTTTALVG